MKFDPFAKRFPIRIWFGLLPLFALLGMTPGRSYIEVSSDTVTARMGPLGKAEIPRKSVVRVSRARWTILGGLGIRIFPGGVGFVGSLHNVAMLHLSEPVRVRAVFPVRVRKFAVSVPDVPALARALGFVQTDGRK
jgi:hypothetical protein